jgi:hypothetical protein
VRDDLANASQQLAFALGRPRSAEIVSPKMIESECPQDCGGVLRFDLGLRFHRAKARCEAVGPQQTTCRAWWWWDALSEMWLPMSSGGITADQPLGEIDL